MSFAGQERKQESTIAPDPPAMKILTWVPSRRPSAGRSLAPPARPAHAVGQPTFRRATTRRPLVNGPYRPPHNSPLREPTGGPKRRLSGAPWQPTRQCCWLPQARRVDGYGVPFGRAMLLRRRRPGPPKLECQNDDVEEQPLEGGIANAGQVVRAGPHVLRASSRYSGAIHAFLVAVHNDGFEGAPTPVGIDKGRTRAAL